MLTSPHGQPRCLVFAEAQPGDEFYLVDISRFTASPVSVALYQNTPQYSAHSRRLGRW